MRRNRRNREDIIIDLTSLLDVIFIILLIVLCSQDRVAESMQESEKKAQEAVAEAEDTIRLYEEQRETEDSLKQYVWTASIIVPYETDEITVRHIKLLQEDEAIQTFDLVGNNVEKSLRDFKAALTEYIERNTDRPVILSLNEEDGRILYRDEKAVNEILNELTREYANVYLKGSLAEE